MVLPNRHHVLRRGVIVALAVAALGAFAGGGLHRLRLTTSVTSILPAQDRTVATWQAEEKVFGGPPIAIELTEPRANELLSGTPLLHLTRLEGQLAQLPNVAVTYGPGTVLNQLGIAAGDLLAELTGYRQGLIDRAEAAARAAGTSPTAAAQAAAEQFDLRYGPDVVDGLPIGLPSLSNPSFGPEVFLGSSGPAQAAFHWLVPSAHQVDVFVRPGSTVTEAQASQMVSAARLLVRRAGFPSGVHATVTGLPVLAVSLGQAIAHELPLLAVLAILGVLVSFLVTRRQLRWWRRLVPFGAGVGALVLTLAVLGWFGQGLSVGVLVFLPIMVGIGTDYPIYAANRIDTRWLVALAMAGAAGCASLGLSPLPFVRELGIALALGLLLSLATGLALARLGGASTPHCTASARPRGDANPHAGAPVGTRTETVVDGGGPWEPGTRLPDPVSTGPRNTGTRRPAMVVLATVTVLGAAAGWISLASLPIQGTLSELAAGVPGIGQALAAQSALGVGGDLDVSVQANDVLTPAMLRWYKEADDAIIARDGNQLRPVVSPTSLLSWLGSNPTDAQISTALSVIPSYLTGAAFSGDLHHADLVFGADVTNLAHDQQLVASVHHVLPPLPPGAHLHITGLVAVVAQGYQLLGHGTLWTDLAGIGAFGVVLLALAWRQRDAVLRAVIAAFLAVGWGAVALRVGDVALSPLAVAVGSVTTAVGGEFTFVAALWLRRRGTSPWPVVLRAGVTSTVGFIVLAVSELSMVRQFGVILAGSIVLSMAAAMVVLWPGSPWDPRRATSGLWRVRVALAHRSLRASRAETSVTATGLSSASLGECGAGRPWSREPATWEQPPCACACEAECGDQKVRADVGSAS